MPKTSIARPESEDSLLVTAAKAIGRAAGRVATIGRSPSEAQTAAKNTKAQPTTKRRASTQDKKRKPVKRRAATPRAL
jgi:hypothetical protein